MAPAESTVQLAAQPTPALKDTFPVAVNAVRPVNATLFVPVVAPKLKAKLAGVNIVVVIEKVCVPVVNKASVPEFAETFPALVILAIVTFPDICVVPDVKVKQGADAQDVAFQVPDKANGPPIVQLPVPPVKVGAAAEPSPILKVKPVAPTVFVDVPLVKVAVPVPSVNPPLKLLVPEVET